MKNTVDKITLLPRYHVLHNSEFPMLIVGKNILGDYLIASFLEEDEDLGKLKYFHVFANDELLLKFLKGTHSYLDVMRGAKEIFLVEKSYNYTILSFKEMVFSDLARDMLPLKSSFFPSSNTILLANLEKRIKTNTIPLLLSNC